MNAHIPLVPATQVHVSAIANLWQAQDRRQHMLDSSLHLPRTQEQITSVLQNQIQGDTPAFVALDSGQHVRAYIVPARWDLSPTSALHAFLTSRNGITEAFVLPDPEDEDAVFIGDAVLRFLSVWWHEQKTTGDLLRWPASDRWLEPLLKEQGFLLDSYCAIRSLEPLEQGVHPPAQIAIRYARPEDEKPLLALFLAEMVAHANSVPCSRVSEVALQGFEHKLRQLWQKAPDQTEPLFILVAEHPVEGVVGMAENVVITVESQEIPGFTPPGRYGCLDNVSVKPEIQGQGVGRLLVDAALSIFPRRDPQVREVLLWYNPDNPTAGRFWPRLGFHDLWTTYQRLHSSAH